MRVLILTTLAQLGLFIHDVDESLNITALDRLEVDWSRAVSVATDGAPSMVGKKVGVVTILKRKFKK